MTERRDKQGKQQNKRPNTNRHCERSEAIHKTKGRESNKQSKGNTPPTQIPP